MSKRLREQGDHRHRRPQCENVGERRDVVVVYSTAIKRDNPELMAARAQRIPRGAPGRDAGRADAAEELRRDRGHAWQDHDDLDGCERCSMPVISIRPLSMAASSMPMAPTRGSVRGDWMVVEADESDGTFLKLPADVAIVTNVDPEHLDHFKTFDAVQDAFKSLSSRSVPFYGFAVMCIDHPVVQTLVGKIEDRRIITYGENPQADVASRRI